MMTMTENMKIENCPTCKRQPRQWWEQPANGSRELFWFGCEKDGLLEGAAKPGATAQKWNRLVAQLKFRMSEEKPKPKHWLFG